MSLSNLGLDAFEVIAETGTIVLASTRLGVTQTALTQRIKSLEAELGTALFIRSRKGMELTPEGQILYKYCQERYQREVRTIQRIQGSSISEPRRIRICGPTMQIQNRLLVHLDRVKKKYPELYFTFDIDDSHDLFPRLKNNQTDIVLTKNVPNASLNFKKLKSSEFILVGPYSWKKLELKEVLRTKSIIDFNEQDDYTISFLQHFKLLPQFLPERHYINNTLQMLMMVEQGLGFAVFDYQNVKEKIGQKKLCNLAPKLKLGAEWYLCWNNYGEEINSSMEDIIQRFII